MLKFGLIFVGETYGICKGQIASLTSRQRKVINVDWIREPVWMLILSILAIAVLDVLARRVSKQWPKTWFVGRWTVIVGAGIILGVIGHLLNPWVDNRANGAVISWLLAVGYFLATVGAIAAPVPWRGSPYFQGER